MDELTDLKKQMMQFEFQQKKDLAESEKRWQRIERQNEKISANLDQISKHIKHLSVLAGVAFERLGELDNRLDSAAESLARKSK